MSSDSGRRFALLAVATLTVMSTATIAPALPHMADAFAGTPHAELLTKLVLTLPALLIVLCAPLVGAAIDRFGRLPILKASLALYGLGGASGYVFDSLGQILAGRALLGVAVAGTMTTVTALVGDYFTGETRSRYASLQSFAMSLGAVAYVGIGGVLAEFDWRLPFLVYLSGWLVLVPVGMFLAEPRRHGEHAGERIAHVRTPWARVGLVYAITLVAVAMFYMTPVQLPFLAREIGIESSALAGLAIMVSSLASAAGAALYGRVRGEIGVFAVYAAAFALIGVGYGLIGLAGSYAAIVFGTLFSGLGVGMFFPNSHLWLLGLAPAALRGRLSGGLTAAIFLGQFASPLLVQPFVAAASLRGAFLAAAVAAFALASALAATRRFA